ncbi:MAG: HD-GYP domain-containing protein [Solirubrobacteraceae bacterium]
MALNPNLEEQELLADMLRRVESIMPLRERVTEGLVVLGFVAAAAALWCERPPHAFALVPAALCLLVMVLATRVRFDTPFGFTVATQLAFVPLLFAMPVAIIPIAVPAVLMIARLPEVLAGTHRPSRLFKEISNSWFAIGPVAVFALADIEPAKAGPVLLLGALTAQFVIDFAVSTLRYGFERAPSFSAQLRETWVYAVDAALASIALFVAKDIHQSALVALAPLPMLALLAVFARERHYRIESLLELNAAYRGTALVLADVVEADDGYTGEHCKAVVALALALADGLRLKLDAEQRRNLEFGALLHDIGKIVIANEIINKPGKLDQLEWEIMQSHTLEGQKLLDRVGGFMRHVGLIVRSHHERWDGRGYPDGLAGEAIPIESRIISCCDSWNAMRTDRSYRKALTHEVARAELIANAGHQFDPRVVEAFLALVEGPPEDLLEPSRALEPEIQIPGRQAPGTIAS